MGIVDAQHVRPVCVCVCVCVHVYVCGAGGDDQDVCCQERRGKVEVCASHDTVLTHLPTYAHAHARTHTHKHTHTQVVGHVERLLANSVRLNPLWKAARR